MRTLLHLSDLHFGRIHVPLVAPLVAFARGLEPDVVVVSGDLTQRARSEQFREARAFLDELPRPQIVVPGNHDVPMHNVVDRFARPLDKYRRYITDDLEPFHYDGEVAVLGVNTARSLTIKGGRINTRQVSQIRSRFCDCGPNVTKVLVTHHPLDVPEGADEDDVVGGARRAIEVLASCGADVVLAGHLHKGFTVETARRYRIAGHSAVVVQAGTATSTRGRGEANSFNVLRVDPESLDVERVEWRPESGEFVSAAVERFRRTPDGWRRGV
jgi:3',5'-cyclic AMP phosphodiesterase CpdA